MVFISQVALQKEFNTGLVVTPTDIARPRIGSFLHRNFITAIKHQVQKRMRGVQDSSEVSNSGRPRHRNDQRATLRRIEENAMLRKDWEFCLDLKQIRKRTGTATSKGTDSIEERPSKKIRLDSIQCHCDVTLFDGRNQTLARASSSGHVIMVNNDRESPVLEISMTEPVTFKSSDLKVYVKETSSSTKMKIVDSYFLQFSIFPKESDDPSWPPIPINRPSSSYTSGPSIIQLLSKWVSLPRLPSDDHLLPIEVLVKPIAGLAQKAPLATKFGLQMKARWINPSPLEAHIRRNGEASIRSLPLPDSESEPASSRSKGKEIKPTVSIVYRFMTTNLTTADWHMRDFRCPFCKEDQQEWNILRVHFTHLHDNFEFEVEELDDTDMGDSIDKRITVGIVNGYPKKSSIQPEDTRTFTWQTPPKPLDIESDPSGQDWKLKPLTAGASLGKPKPRAGARKQSLPLNHSSFSLAVPQPPKGHSKIPEPVRQLSSSTRRRHPVPAAPCNVSFFRSRGKRPVKEGELLTESDDDVDIKWLDQKHSKTLDALSELTLSEKNFLKVYDSYIMSQKLASSRYLPDAILNFAKENREWLLNADMRSEFCKLIGKLHIDGILDEYCIARCLQIVHDKAKEAGADDQIPMDIDEPHNTMNSGDNSKDCAMCHQQVAMRKQGIVCANRNCIAFVHLKCVGLEQRQSGWVCDDCSLDGAP